MKIVDKTYTRKKTASLIFVFLTMMSLYPAFILPLFWVTPGFTLPMRPF